MEIYLQQCNSYTSIFVMVFNITIVSATMFSLTPLFQTLVEGDQISLDLPLCFQSFTPVTPVTPFHPVLSPLAILMYELCCLYSDHLWAFHILSQISVIAWTSNTHPGLKAVSTGPQWVFSAPWNVECTALAYLLHLQGWQVCPSRWCCMNCLYHSSKSKIPFCLFPFIKCPPDNTHTAYLSFRTRGGGGVLLI